MGGKRALLVCLAIGCGGGDPGGPGTVSATQNGDPAGALGGVDLACTSSGSGPVNCSFGDQPPAAGMELSLEFTADYQAAAVATALALGTDFTINGLSFFDDLGFGAGGQDVVVGDLTITIDAQDAATEVTFDGDLEKDPSFPGDPFTMSFDQVPGTLP